MILDWTCSTEEQITTAKLFSDGYQRVKSKKDIPGPPGGRTEKKEREKSLNWEQAFLSCKGPRIKRSFCFPVHHLASKGLMITVMTIDGDKASVAALVDHYLHPKP